jgi:prolyl oligopeptidase PreP (S9A serine peptidase family)
LLCVAANFTVLFEPSPTVSLDSFAATRDYLILETLDTVKSRYTFWRYNDPTDSAGAGAGAGQARWTFCGTEKSKFTALFHAFSELQMIPKAALYCCVY